ncbi:DUF4270 domain-containing protein [Thalassobellus suaedae]|uniref:DUF4270 domain-containing protein n=1 Tax=Thalassobellus suaedae TaxID=3074124 RepID=A0ABY9Y7I7_9FLAO|nr:DUF4270 domain-containing protein [Flavobacteriaceae bacterium HL-DH10]
MKKIIKALKFPVTFLLILVSFIACDKDFSVIESDVLGKENANFLTDSVYLPISAYNKKLDSVQINGLASNLLGVFNDPAYGQTTANIVTQITPTTFNPDFGINTKIDSVVLTIPLFSRTITDSTYTISDSLYGNSPIKLSVYKNDYFLRDFDPNSTLGTSQKYYSKSDGTVLNGTSVINFEDHKSDLILEDLDFIPSNKRIRLDVSDTDGTITTSYSTPALRTKLDTLFWRNTIINKQDDPVLSNPSNFNNYFRGLYFKAEAIDGKGNMILLNLASTGANIIIYYSKDSSVAGERTQSTYTFNFTGNKLNTFINDYNLVSLQNGNKDLGDTKLYLKGGAGSMGVIDLFNGNVEYTDENNTTSIITALDAFKKSYRKTDATGEFIKDSNTGNYILKRLINEVFLTIYEDEEINIGTYSNEFHKYDRIYAYDIENNQSTIDYQIDPIDSKLISLSQRDTILGKYKIRLTEHLNNILLRDSTNTKIGLVLSNNVNYTNNAEILNSNDAVTGIPAAAIISPRGTILYGSNENVPDNKRLKLKIFYTEPKGN